MIPKEIVPFKYEKSALQLPSEHGLVSITAKFLSKLDDNDDDNDDDDDDENDNDNADNYNNDADNDDNDDDDDVEVKRRPAIVSNQKVSPPSSIILKKKCSRVLRLTCPTTFYL